MWKLIKMDSYRLFSSKAFKVGAIIAALVCAGYMLASLGIIAIAKIAFKSNPSMATDLGMLLSQLAWMNGVNFSEIVFGSTGILSLFIGCMITANFIGAEQSCGYTKNFAGQLSNKGYMVISKFAVTSLVQLAVLAIYAALSSVLALIFFGQYINGYEIGTLFWALGLRLMLHLAINAIVMSVCMLTKSHAIAMVAGCLLGLGVTKVAYTAVGMALSLLRIDFFIEKYVPDGINGLLSLGSVSELSVRAMVVSIVFMALFLAITYFVVRKRDVR